MMDTPRGRRCSSGVLLPYLEGPCTTCGARFVFTRPMKYRLMMRRHGYYDRLMHSHSFASSCVGDKGRWRYSAKSYGFNALLTFVDPRAYLVGPTHDHRRQVIFPNPALHRIVHPSALHLCRGRDQTQAGKG